MQMGDTCRSPACHPRAGENISTAAIHLNLPTSRGVEFLIAVIFVLLIIFTFGPSLLLTALKMLQNVIARRNGEHEHHLATAKRLLADPAARMQLQRFTLHQRIQHWFLVLCFTTLVLTGFPIKFADDAWAAWVVGKLGGLPVARLMHRWAGALLIAGFFYHLIYISWTVILGQRLNGKGLVRTIWELPMMLRPTDGKEMLQLLLYVLGLRRLRPASGRFNPEEKFEYIGVFWGTFVLGVTGLLMWFNASASRYVAGRILTVAALVHTFEAFLALLHVGIVHMAGVIFSPGVFPVSKAMFSSDTPPEELVEGHGGMLAAVEQMHAKGGGGPNHA
jgi:cytochrome b subunit of formate dehydrogenase